MDLNRLDERQVVASFIVALHEGGQSFEVRNRDFDRCSLVNRGDMSRTRFKQALRWLIAQGCVRRFRFEVIELNGVELCIPAEPMSPHSKCFGEVDELWVYHPTRAAEEFVHQHELLCG